ncbi:MAG: hypothetical protein IH898_07980 [Planctomycetes bacterium]|nr:hypothetical protein [Planctomycetota bacterium]
MDLNAPDISWVQETGWPVTGSRVNGLALELRTTDFSPLTLNTINVEITTNIIVTDIVNCLELPNTPDNCKKDYPAGSLNEVTQLIYWAEAIDSAGNDVQITPVILALHPVANFVPGAVRIPIGGSAQVAIQVRNLESADALITLDLTDYQPAAFIAGTGSWTDLIIDPDGRGATITGLPSGGGGTVIVELLPVDPNIASRQLDLRATSNQLPGDVYFDKMFIEVVFSTSFDGLTDFMLILLGLLGLLFYIRTKKDQ